MLVCAVVTSTYKIVELANENNKGERNDKRLKRGTSEGMLLFFLQFFIDNIR